MQNGTLPDQQVHWETLQDLIEQDIPLNSPATLVVGEVVHWAQLLAGELDANLRLPSLPAPAERLLVQESMQPL